MIPVRGQMTERQRQADRRCVHRLRGQQRPRESELWPAAPARHSPHWRSPNVLPPRTAAARKSCSRRRRSPCSSRRYRSGPRRPGSSAGVCRALEHQESPAPQRTSPTSMSRSPSPPTRRPSLLRWATTSRSSSARPGPKPREMRDGHGNRGGSAYARTATRTRITPHSLRNPASVWADSDDRVELTGCVHLSTNTSRVAASPE